MHDCDNHLDITRLVNKIEVLYINYFEALKDEVFEELPLKLLLNEIGVHDDETVMES